MEARLRGLLTAAYGCLERLRSPVASSSTLQTPEDAGWRVIAVFFPRLDLEATQAAGSRLAQRWPGSERRMHKVFELRTAGLQHAHDLRRTRARNETSAESRQEGQQR